MMKWIKHIQVQYLQICSNNLLMKVDRALACNYRPVSMTCVPCKLLEHIVFNCLFFCLFFFFFFFFFV